MWDTALRCRVVYGSDVVEIVLYGSYARGDYAEDSDIDIVAVVHGSRIDLQEKLNLDWKTILLFPRQLFRMTSL